MKKEHSVFLLISIVLSVAALAGLGKIDSKQALDAIALVLAYLAPSPVLADISKGDK